ncbi:MAG: hypothetical protein ACKVQC_10725 [Elusimicrobiota bacterium]
MNTIFSKRLVFSIFFGLGLICSSVMGWYHYLYFSSAVPADHLEMNVRALCRELGEFCERKNFKGVITELDVIEGIEEGEFSSFVMSLINSEFSVIFEKMVAAGNVRKLAISQVNEALKDKEWNGKNPDITKMSPDFFLVSRWTWIVPKEKFQLSIKIVRCSINADFVEGTKQIVFPPFLEKLKIKKEKARWPFIGSLGCTMFCFLGFLWQLRPTH